MHTPTSLDAPTLLALANAQAELVRVGPDLGRILALAARQLLELTRGDGAVVELAEQDQMVYRGVAGSAQGQLGLRVPIQGSLAGQAVRTGCLLWTDDALDDPRVDRAACLRVGLRAMAVAPLSHDGTTVGALKVLSSLPSGLRPQDREVLALLATFVGGLLYYTVSFDMHDLYRRATTDPLTGLANRALFYDRLRQQIAQAERQRHAVAVISADMDGLKRINDSFGHQAGDCAIVTTALRIASVCREEDTVARLGGDEFAIVLPRIGGRDDALTLAERIRSCVIAEAPRFKDVALPLGLSIGCALYPADGTEIDALIDVADQAMYAMKRRRTTAPLA